MWIVRFEFRPGESMWLARRGSGFPLTCFEDRRDSFGTESELRPVLARMPAATLHIVEGADHSLNIRRKSAPPREEIYAAVMDEIVAWVRAVVE